MASTSYGPDDSRVYVIFSPQDQGGRQLVCGPYTIATFCSYGSRLNVCAYIEGADGEDGEFFTVGYQEGDGWRAHPTVKEDSPLYRSVWVRSTLPLGCPCREAGKHLRIVPEAGPGAA